MDSDSLAYDLPEAAIAQHPVEPRDSARLLVDRGTAGPVHRRVSDLPELLEPGDVVVVNSSRVIPARLHLRKPTGGAVEVLLLERKPEGWWEALVRPSRRVADGTVLAFDGDVAFEATVGPVLNDDGRRRVDLSGEPSAVGEIPLPPYIHEPLADPDRYQTVYADAAGSVAAPTAGLHITAGVLANLTSRDIAVATIDLAVGLGTFRPITTDRVEDHPMHAERYSIPDETIDLIARRRTGGGRVIAIGTTVVRCLESWARTGRTEDATDLFIHGDQRFEVVDRLVTNFHVPRSSLLALVEAFVGPRWRDLYAAALRDGYRFLSFGDAMLLDRRSD